MSWEEWSKRPARRQVDEASLEKHLREEAQKERNVWNGRVIGGGGDGPGGRRNKERSKYRCIPQLDCGRTRGSDAKQRTFCLYFAKGCCSQGSMCTYLHRLPTADDEAYHKKDMGADIFGREKRAEHEGYRKGAGTFERDNRTLYVNYEGAGSLELPKVRELMHANFSAWGKVDSIYIKHVSTLAFVKYEWRSCAEFAKEAMHKQGLQGSTQGEVLTVRWANEDPNPVAVVAKKRHYRDAFEEAAMAAWEALPEEQKQARIMQLKLAAALKRGHVVGSYPNTDGAYGDAPRGPPAAEGEFEDAYPDTDAQYGGAEAVAGGSHHHYPSTDSQYAGEGGGPSGGPAGAEGAGGPGGGAWWGGEPTGYGAAGADDAAQYTPEQYRQWMQYYQWQQYYESQQQQQGAGAGAGQAGGDVQAVQGEGAQGAAGEAAAAKEESEEGAGGLGLLAGYGSDSDDEAGAEGAKDKGAEEKEAGGKEGSSEAQEAVKQVEGGAE